MSTRRDFLKSIGFAAVAAPFIPWHLAGQAFDRSTETVGLFAGQTVEDIVFGYSCTPADVGHLMTFYLASAPEVPRLQIALNQRASFRWIAAPGCEIHVPPGDKLLWRDRKDNGSYFGEAAGDARADVWTQGRDAKTGRVIINQTHYV